MNDTPTAAQALLALSRSSTARTQVARLRELLPEIEAAQAAGVKHQHILESLNAHGFALSMKAYSVMLYRLRQARAKSAGAGASAGAPQPAVQAPAAAGIAEKASGAQNPAAAPAASPTDPKPGEPKRFDWDTLKNTPPQW
ncbi:MAG: hypothetical protein NTZ64_15485 [Polaromonas sp.]|nr:hypothetical protein [Polaromonas sp.]